MTFFTEFSPLDSTLLLPVRDWLVANDPYWNVNAKGHKTVMTQTNFLIRKFRPEFDLLKLNAGHFAEVYREGERLGNSPKTGNRRCSNLSKMNRTLVMHGLMDRQVLFQRAPETRKKIVIHSQQDLDVLPSLLRSGENGEDVADAFIFSRCTGARQGEVLRLLYTDICFEPEPYVVFRDTKVQSEDRVIPLVGEALEVMRRRYEMRIDNDRVFPIDRDTLLRRLRTAQKLAGVDDMKAKNWHSLRHNFVSAMQRQNIPLSVIMSVVGHKNSQTTLRVYSHTQLGEKAKALAALDG